MTPWTVARKAPLSLLFSRQEYWSGLPLPPPGDLPELGGTKPASLASPALACGFFTTTTWEACTHTHTHTHTHMHTFFSIMVYHRILNIVLCAIQKDLVILFFFFRVPQLVMIYSFVYLFTVFFPLVFKTQKGRNCSFPPASGMGLDKQQTLHIC